MVFLILFVSIGAVCAAETYDSNNKLDHSPELQSISDSEWDDDSDFDSFYDDEDDYDSEWDDDSDLGESDEDDGYYGDYNNRFGCRLF